MADRAESADERALRRELQELAKKREVLDSSSRRSVLARLGGETTRAGGAGRHVQLKENNSRGNASWRLGKRDNEDNRQSSAVKRQRLHSAVARPEGSHDEERAEASRTSTSATSPSVDNARAQERKQRAVAPYAQKEGIARSRRMFGALMGHLGKAKRQIEKDTDLFKRQDTKQHEAEQREKMQSQNLENQARHEAEVARLQALIARTELDRSEQIARAKLEHLQLLRKSENQGAGCCVDGSSRSKMKASVQTHEEKLRKLEAEFATKLRSFGDNEKDTAKASSAKKEPEEDKKDGQGSGDEMSDGSPKDSAMEVEDEDIPQENGATEARRSDDGEKNDNAVDTKSDCKAEKDSVNGASVAHSDTEASSPSRVKDDEKTVEQVKEESESPKQSNEAGVTKESATDDGSAKLESNDAKTEAPVEPKEDPAAHVDKMKVAELRAELKKRGLDTKGLKVILVQRLKQAMHGDDESK
ncbi:Pinin/SDK/MemA protein [Phytophthora cactorum]|nr:Pinin/SDK/MemA protein [Phytophthora cactorum]